MDRPEPDLVVLHAESKVSARRVVRWDDRIFQYSLRALAVGVIVALGLIVYFLGRLSLPILQHSGWAFLMQSRWDPVGEHFGVLTFIFGTVVSSLLAIALATPVSVAMALFLNEIAPGRVASVVGFLVEMLAAIPSVVYGLWGIFVLAPWLRSSVEPFLSDHFGFLPFFDGAPYGVGMLAGGVILAIMITPTISAIAREVFRAIPRQQREAALALGATRWETMDLAVLRSARSGLLAAVMLGLGRALGETMAVTMVIGNRPEISASLFSPAQTMASVIANEYAEATSDLHLSALAAVGLTLFLVSLLINSFARLVIWRLERRFGHS